MPSYCEEQYIHALEKKVKEQDAMIDWLVDELISNAGLAPVKDWRKEARKAVSEADNA